MITAIVGLIGISATLISWFFNPKRILYARIDAIYKELETLYVRRDKALQNNDSDELTLVTSLILRLCNEKTRIFQRL